MVSGWWGKGAPSTIKSVYPILLLDEPTNHLDLEMCHALTQALQEFDGAVVVISHDRHLLRNTVDELLLVDQCRAEPYTGSLDDYRDWLLSRNREKTEAPAQDASNASSVDKKQARQDAAAQRAKLAPITKALKQVESKIEKIAKRLNELETALADSTLYEETQKEKLKTLLAEQAQLNKDNDALEEQWLELQEQLETLSASR